MADATSQLDAFARMVTERWLEMLLRDQRTFIPEDIEMCLQALETFSPADKNKFHWLLMSEELEDWLHAPDSRILFVERATGPQEDDVYDAVSAALAVVMGVLHNKRYLTIANFCGVRTAAEVYQRAVAGTKATMARLLAQLLLEVWHERRGINLTSLAEPYHMPSGGFYPCNFVVRQMQHVINALPLGDCVFIILSSVWHLLGPHREVINAVELLIRLAGSRGVVVKILISDFGNNPTSHADATTLVLPDFVNEGAREIDLGFYEGHIIEELGEFEEMYFG